MIRMRSSLLWVALLTRCLGAKLNLRRGGHQEQRHERRRLSSSPCLVLLETTQFEDNTDSSSVFCEVQELTLGPQLYQIDSLDEEWVTSHGVISGETTMEAPGATVEGNKIHLEDASTVSLHNTLGGDNGVNVFEHGHDDRRLQRAGGAENVDFQHNHDRQLQQRRRLNVFGDLTVLVVRVVARDASTSASRTDLAREIFGFGSDSFNFKSQTEACSIGQVDIIPANDNPQRINNGVITVNINTNVVGVDRNEVRQRVISQLESDLGTNQLQSRYDHVMLCLPPGTGTDDFIAYAFVGWYQSIYNDNWCLSPSAAMHEIGHNWGLAHSGAGNNQYADRSGMMGFSYRQDEGPIMCFNAVKSWELGWYRGGHRTINPLQQDWEGNIVGFVEFGMQLAFSALGLNTIIRLQGDSEYEYFVSYNKRAGRNSGTQGGGNQVLVTRKKIGISYSTSYRMAALFEDQTYTVAFGGSNLRVKFLRIDYTLANQKAVVRIST